MPSYASDKANSTSDLERHFKKGRENSHLYRELLNIVKNDACHWNFFSLQRPCGIFPVFRYCKYGHCQSYSCVILKTSVRLILGVSKVDWYILEKCDCVLPSFDKISTW
ncbi:uncharacterized protein DS421_14g460800 [Arachis hypogaea]|nr:uncharacterized protein DS421_14g460800 [Arachis hypogaea]